jgi:hypothetical protein
MATTGATIMVALLKQSNNDARTVEDDEQQYLHGNGEEGIVVGPCRLLHCRSLPHY